MPLQFEVNAMSLSGMLSRGRNAVKIDARLGPPGTLRWLAVVAWTGGIFYLSHQSEPAGASVNYAMSVAAHIVVYGGLGTLLCWALAGEGAGPVRTSAWVVGTVAFALTVLYGVSDELHQVFVPGRVASEMDVGIDGVGALLGVTTWMAWSRSLRRRS